jgi:hypothetical protein
MDVRPKSSALAAKTLVLLFVFVMVAILLMRPPLTSSNARGQAERVFEDAIPENAPIRIKIKKEKEKSFKELKDETWVEEFELEVKNVGEKPIYLIFIDLVTDVRVGGDRLVFSLVYGRAELGDIITKAGPDDPSIKPGETYVFKIHPGQVPAWEQSVREKSHPDASRLQAKLEMLSYGDVPATFLTSRIHQQTSTAPRLTIRRCKNACMKPHSRPERSMQEYLYETVGKLLTSVYQQAYRRLV